MVTDDPRLDYERLRYIELRGDGSKLPARSWGGYDQDFETAEHVHTHDDVEMYPMDNWGVVDVESPDHTALSLLIFDIDVHKAPSDFDADRLTVPDDSLLVRSQSGGFHLYFILNGYGRGDLNESDFQMTADPGFDIDIRGSAVCHHVVAPADIPGIGGDYEIVSDEGITPVSDPQDAASRIQLDGEPLLEFSPEERAGGYEFDFDEPDEAPDDMPMCYRHGLELRAAAPDDHPNTHKVNVLTAACGLAAGYDPDAVAAHFCEEYAPYDGGVDRSDREATEYQIRHIDGSYAPPSEQTLRDYGILNEGESCDADCPISYHGTDGDNRPALDVVADGRDARAEAAAVVGQPNETAETDGGATTANSGDGSRSGSFLTDVQSYVTEVHEGDIKAQTARHRIACALVDHYDFIHPEEGVQGWRERLYVYNSDEGVYEPRGETFIEGRLEVAAGDFVTNQTRNEIVEKVKRMVVARGEEFDTPPERLVVGNGILDLHTGELSGYTPAEYHRRKIDVNWNPDAGDPDHIDEFFHDIVDDSDVDTLYRLIAHTLYKEYLSEKAAILIGSGQNGKSVFLELVERFIGQGNVSHRELQDFDDDQFAANNLQGKFANLATEIGEQELNDTTTFKKLTGRDTLDAQVKFETPVTFENYATLMFATNEMPVFGQDNHAIWRRWLFLDFPYTFSDDDAQAKDPIPKRRLLRRLTQDREFEALLVRCQQEIQRWHEGEQLFADAMDPDEVREKMKKAAEPIYAFATECLEATDEEGGYVEKSVVRACYTAFADEEDLPRMADNEFGKRLMGLREFVSDTGQRRVDGKRVRVYEGVQLSARGRQVLGIDEPGDGQETVDEERVNAKPHVMETLRSMVEENGGEPVPREGVVWSAVGPIGKANAKRALDELCKQGDVMATDGDVIPTS